MGMVLKWKNVRMLKLNFLTGHRPLECTLRVNKEGPCPRRLSSG